MPVITYGEMYDRFLERHPEFKGRVRDYRPYTTFAIILWTDNKEVIATYHPMKDDWTLSIGESIRKDKTI